MFINRAELSSIASSRASLWDLSEGELGQGHAVYSALASEFLNAGLSKSSLTETVWQVKVGERRLPLF